MGKYRVAYATGSRADYGIVKNQCCYLLLCHMSLPYSLLFCPSKNGQYIPFTQQLYHIPKVNSNISAISSANKNCSCPQLETGTKNP